MSHCFLEAFERVPKSKAAEYEQLSRDTDLEVKRSEPGHLIHAQTKIAEDENEIVYRWLEIYKDADALKAHFDNPVVAKHIQALSDGEVLKGLVKVVIYADWTEEEKAPFRDLRNVDLSFADLVNGFYR